MTHVQPAALLYVEDDPFIQEELEAALIAAGFDVVTAADGNEAMAALRADGQAFIGLITDIDLGEGPDGWDLAREARERSAGLPVVYVSGASAHNWTVQGVPHSVMIGKPFAAAQVVIAISTLINETDGAGAGPDA